MRGRLIAKRPPRLLLDVQGVGYELEAPMSTFYVLPSLGEEVTLFAHHVVRDDAQSLYGFATEDERNVFRMLLRVNGVGAKIGLAILSGMDGGSFARCIFEGDAETLAKLPGIGKKTADRLIIEMRDRLERMPMRGAVAGETPPAADDPVREAVSALVALGFKPQEASRRVRALDCEGLPCEEIVRGALQSMVKSQ